MGPSQPPGSLGWACKNVWTEAGQADGGQGLLTAGGASWGSPLAPCSFYLADDTMASYRALSAVTCHRTETETKSKTFIDSEPICVNNNTKIRAGYSILFSASSGLNNGVHFSFHHRGGIAPWPLEIHRDHLRLLRAFGVFMPLLRLDREITNVGQLENSP